MCATFQNLLYRQLEWNYNHVQIQQVQVKRSFAEFRLQRSSYERLCNTKFSVYRYSERKAWATGVDLDKALHCLPLVQYFVDIWAGTVNPLYTDTRYNDKFLYNDKLHVTKPRSRGDSKWEIMQEYCIKISSNICFGYLLESPQWGDSNKYPKHNMFYEKIRIKQGISYISFCFLAKECVQYWFIA